MSYFIFNDIDSRDMGIIVQSLPPIVQPPKMYERYDIQGSNRTEIYDLGYTAYEKSIVIGMKNKSLLNNVIGWLQGEGKLITSDEPDKYYNVRFLAQQSYERLRNFKQATIAMLCQPYKYLVNESTLTFTGNKTITNEGNAPCKPIFKFYGSNVTVSINGNESFSIAGIDSYITVDTLNMECHKDGTLQNRKISGDFWNIELNPGDNEITVTGATSWEIKVGARWI
jgi:predicted phage tail component-like protein